MLWDCHLLRIEARLDQSKTLCKGLWDQYYSKSKKPKLFKPFLPQLRSFLSYSQLWFHQQDGLPLPKITDQAHEYDNNTKLIVRTHFLQVWDFVGHPQVHHCPIQSQATWKAMSPEGRPTGGLWWRVHKDLYILKVFDKEMKSLVNRNQCTPGLRGEPGVQLGLA